MSVLLQDENVCGSGPSDIPGNELTTFHSLSELLSCKAFSSQATIGLTDIVRLNDSQQKDNSSEVQCLITPVKRNNVTADSCSSFLQNLPLTRTSTRRSSHARYNIQQLTDNGDIRRHFPVSTRCAFKQTGSPKQNKCPSAIYESATSVSEQSCSSSSSDNVSFASSDENLSLSGEAGGFQPVSSKRKRLSNADCNTTNLCGWKSNKIQCSNFPNLYQDYAENVQNRKPLVSMGSWIKSHPRYALQHRQIQQIQQQNLHLDEGLKHCSSSKEASDLPYGPICSVPLPEGFTVSERPVPCVPVPYPWCAPVTPPTQLLSMALADSVNCKAKREPSTSNSRTVETQTSPSLCIIDNDACFAGHRQSANSGLKRFSAGFSSNSSAKRLSTGKGPSTRRISTGLLASVTGKRCRSPLSGNNGVENSATRSRRSSGATQVLSNLKRTFGQIRRAISAERLNKLEDDMKLGECNRFATDAVAAAKCDTKVSNATETPIQRFKRQRSPQLQKMKGQNVHAAALLRQNAPSTVVTSPKKLNNLSSGYKLRSSSHTIINSACPPVTEKRPASVVGTFGDNLYQPVDKLGPSRIQCKVIECYTDGSILVQLVRACPRDQFGFYIARDSRGIYISRLGSVRSSANLWDIMHVGDRVLSLQDVDFSQNTMDVAAARNLVAGSLCLQMRIKPATACEVTQVPVRMTQTVTRHSEGVTAKSILATGKARLSSLQQEMHHY